VSRALTVLMPFHTPFYAPLAAGVALGHFADAGLDISAVPARFGKGRCRRCWTATSRSAWAGSCAASSWG
jgi:hypothetical protein